MPHYNKDTDRGHGLEQIYITKDERKIEVQRSWIEVSIPQLRTNYETYQSKYVDNKDIMAVVKANGYGHGERLIGKALNEFGVNHYAVSNLYEGIHLRDIGVTGHILVLGYTPVEEIHLLKEYHIAQTILSGDYCDELLDSKIDTDGIEFHVSINTGMNRIGLNAEQMEECEKKIRAYAEKLKLVGIFTHLCVADSQAEEDIAFTNQQIKSFETLVERLSDLNFKYVHCMNSAGGVQYTSKYTNLSRLGIILYGIRPSKEITLCEEIKPVLTWKTVVSMVREIGPKATVGYGRTFAADKNMRIAVLPTGYADGYNRKIAKNGYVLLKGQRAPILGSICMDQMMVDVSDIKDVEIGDEVVLLGTDGEETLTAEQLGDWCDTIPYEIICGISARVERLAIQ